MTTFTQKTIDGTTNIQCDACRLLRSFRNPFALRKWKDAHNGCGGAT